MVLKAGVKTEKRSASSLVSTTKTGAGKPTFKSKNDVELSKRAKKSKVRQTSRGRSKTADYVHRKTAEAPPPKRTVSAGGPIDSRLEDEKDSSGWANAKPENNESQQNEEKNETPAPVDKNKTEKADSGNKMSEGGEKKMLIYEKPSETYSELLKKGFTRRSARSKSSKKPSEIPRLKLLCNIVGKKIELPLVKTELAKTSTPAEMAPTSETTEQKQSDEGQKLKKDMKDDKVTAAMRENFNALVPLYETDLKKITDTWVNTIYCSLMMRSNLVKLLYQALPDINKSQFNFEDETILQRIARVKNHTRSESENLIQFIKLLIANRNKTRNDYIVMMENKVIADSYNNNWRALMKRIVDIGEETKQIQMEIPEFIKRRESYEAFMKEKMDKLKDSLSQKDEEIKKLSNQLTILKQRENSYRGNVSLKIEDYKDIKEEVVMLSSIEKEFEELKTKYTNQNEIFEKQIKDLQNSLNEKIKILKTEKDKKKQLRRFLLQLNSQQQQLYRRIGKEQVDFVMGRSLDTSSKRREQLWIASIRLVLKGFLVQMRKLERDKNKMLLELHTNDLENYNNLATTIMQKQNFIKSIRRQMQTLHMASKNSTVKTSASSITDILRS